MYVLTHIMIDIRIFKPFCLVHIFKKWYKIIIIFWCDYFLYSNIYLFICFKRTEKCISNMTAPISLYKLISLFAWKYSKAERKRLVILCHRHIINQQLQSIFEPPLPYGFFTKHFLVRKSFVYTKLFLLLLLKAYM